MSYFLSLALLLLPLLGESQTSFPSDEEWEKRVLDDPSEAREEKSRELSAIDPSDSPREWFDSFVKLEMAISYEDRRDSFATLARLLEVAGSLKSRLNEPEILLEFKRISIVLQVEQGRLASTEALNQLIAAAQEAKRRGFPLLEVKIYQDLSRLYFKEGNYSDALAILNRGLEITQESLKRSPYFLHTFLQNIRIVLNRDLQEQSSSSILQILLDSCSKNKWRFFCFSLHYNQASFYLNRGDKALIAKINTHLVETEKYFNLLKLPGEEGYVHYLWLKYYTLIGDPDQALESGRRALHLFQESGPTEFEVFSYLQIAGVLKQAKRYPEALVYNARAQNLLKKNNYQAALKDTYELNYSIYKETGQYQKALNEHEKMFQLWKEDLSARDRVDYNQKASQIGLAAEEERNRLLKQQLDSQGLIQRITIALLVLSIVAVILMAGAFRQYRRIQALVAREKLALEQERQEEIIRLESRHRTSLAAAVAHKMNNPLNYLGLQIAELDQSMSSLSLILAAILPESADAGLEERELRENILNLVRELSATKEGMSQSLLLTQKVVAELRALSGIDGGMIEAIRLGDVLERTLERLRELLSPMDFGRLEIDIGPLDREFILVTDRFILKHGLEQVFLYFLYKIPGPLKIGITTREQQLSLILPPLSDSIVASLEALEASLRSLLTTAALSPSLHWDQDIYFYSFAPIGESQVMAA